MVVKSFAGRPITASSRFWSSSAFRMRPSAWPRKRTPWGTITATRPLRGLAISIMCVMKA